VCARRRLTPTAILLHKYQDKNLEQRRKGTNIPLGLMKASRATGTDNLTEDKGQHSTKNSIKATCRYSALQRSCGAGVEQKSFAEV